MPDTGKAIYWFNLYDQLFGSKESDGKDSATSSSFRVLHATDEMLVLKGMTTMDEHWKVTITPASVTARYKYTACVKVGKKICTDLVVYGRPLNVTVLTIASPTGPNITRRRTTQETRD